MLACPLRVLYVEPIDHPVVVRLTGEVRPRGVEPVLVVDPDEQGGYGERLADPTGAALGQSLGLYHPY